MNPEIEKADGKWRFILYDLDASSAMYPESIGYYSDVLNTMGGINQSEYNYVKLFRKLCKNEKFCKLFYENYLHVMETCFSPERTDAMIDRYVSEYKPVIQDTFYRFGKDWEPEVFDKEVARFRRFFQKRPAYAKNQLEY